MGSNARPTTISEKCFPSHLALPMRTCILLRNSLRQRKPRKFVALANFNYRSCSSFSQCSFSGHVHVVKMCGLTSCLFSLAVGLVLVQAITVGEIASCPEKREYGPTLYECPRVVNKRIMEDELVSIVLRCKIAHSTTIFKNLFAKLNCVRVISLVIRSP